MDSKTETAGEAASGRLALKTAFAARFRERLDPILRAAPAGQGPALEKGLRPGSAEPDLWETANALGNLQNTPGIDPALAPLCKEAIAEIREFQGRLAREFPRPTTVVFGTSGWREPIGEGFNLENVRKVAKAIARMMASPAFLGKNGYASAEAARAAGVLIFRDNRYMGEEFAAAAAREFRRAGFKVFDAGECPTGVGSAVLTELKGAGSVNFTPSHNPMEYAGLKFNPRDGGPADVDLTSLIELEANALMGAEHPEAPAGEEAAAEEGDPSFGSLEKVDAKEIYRKFLSRSEVFDLARIRSFLEREKERLALVIDFMHGSARGYVERVLGEDLVQSLEAAGSLVRLHTDEDFSFHGVKPEPSARNQKPLMDLLRRKARPLSLAVALDPDADRIRFADAHLDIDMNRFGAVFYAHLLGRGLEGGIASTAPSSDFALEIAKRENQPVYEQAVGFKNFRPALLARQALVAFEESDGISFIGHTLEKDAIGGFLAALEAMAAEGRNLSALYADQQERYGYFYPDKAGADVKGVGVEAWQRYKREVVERLETGLFSPGDRVKIGAKEKEIASINTVDGLKLVFADRSWILLRASGTEPKFRYYYEVTSPSPLAAVEKRLAEYQDAAAAILQKARDLVEGRRG